MDPSIYQPISVYLRHTHKNKRITC